MEYFQNPSDTAPLLGYGCYIEATTLMIYKVTSVIAATTTDTTATNSFSVSHTSTASTTTVNGFSQYSFTSFSTTTVSQSSNVSPTKSNHAWIAGPVIGAFVGCIILLGLAFWIWSLYRRLAKQKQDVKAADNNAEKPVQIQPSVHNVMTTGRYGPQELAGDRGVEVPVTDLRSELPAVQYR